MTIFHHNLHHTCFLSKKTGAVWWEQSLICILFYIFGMAVLFLNVQPALVSSLVNSTGLNMGCVGTKPEQDPIGKSMGNDDNRNLTTHYSKDPTTGSKDVSRRSISLS